MTELSLSSAVYIVGAGPGDPELLTIRAQRILAQADAILYANSLVPHQVLQGVRPEAELIPTGHQVLESILPMMIERVRQGKVVVRLHSGDPSLYSAIAEQIEGLLAAQIPFEIVPGISAFQLAAARLGVELTIPHLVQTIILTRVSGRASQVPAAEELKSLAAHQASLCLYLSARHVRQAQEDLLQHYPANTPVAICYRLGWPDEKVMVVPLDQMALQTQQAQLIRTTLYLISPALKGMQERYSSRVAGRSQLYHPNHSHLFRA